MILNMKYEYQDRRLFATNLLSLEIKNYQQRWWRRMLEQFSFVLAFNLSRIFEKGPRG